MSGLGKVQAERGRAKVAPALNGVARVAGRAQVLQQVPRRLQAPASALSPHDGRHQRGAATSAGRQEPRGAPRADDGRSGRGTHLPRLFRRSARGQLPSMCASNEGPASAVRTRQPAPRAPAPSARAGASSSGRRATTQRAGARTRPPADAPGDATLGDGRLSAHCIAPHGPSVRAGGVPAAPGCPSAFPHQKPLCPSCKSHG